jgi:serine/threonine protein phosphatase 1
MSLTFAIGDIHGCFSKLEALIAHCTAYAGRRQFSFVFLGDYVDRGPDSRRVIEELMSWADHRSDASIFLKGNHEDMLASALADSRAVNEWLTHGGVETLESYNVNDVSALPKAHTDWMKMLPLSHDDGRRFFVHAGIDPAAPLARQTERTMLWTRKHKQTMTDPGRLIVHGHVPLRSGLPEQHRYRLNLDTAAVYGGPLTAGVFNDEQVAPIAFVTDRGTVTPL